MFDFEFGMRLLGCSLAFALLSVGPILFVLRMLRSLR